MGTLCSFLALPSPLTAFESHFFIWESEGWRGKLKWLPVSLMGVQFSSGMMKEFGTDKGSGCTIL
jgi:hypothetical protein